MMTATLGGLIKDYRLKKRLSQQDVSLKIGWKDTTRLSKIEQGRVGKPNRNTAEKIMHALDLTEQERGNFLLVGSYLPIETEIKNGIATIKQKLDTWRYPAYLQDFSFRYLYSNNHFFNLLNIPSKYKKLMEQEKVNLLKTAFEPIYTSGAEDMLGQDEESLIPFKTAITTIIKNDIDAYQNETWYKHLLKELMQYEEFRKLWPKVNENTLKRTLIEYDYEHFTSIYKGKKRTLKFHLSTSRFVKDPRFEVILYYPADKATETFFTS